MLETAKLLLETMPPKKDLVIEDLKNMGRFIQTMQFLTRPRPANARSSSPIGQKRKTPMPPAKPPPGRMLKAQEPNAKRRECNADRK